MKRTSKVILDKCANSPYPKSIRIKPLKRLVALNYAMTISCLETDMSTQDLIDNPTKCVNFIMEVTHVNKRTAYDYYTTLLYMNHHFAAYRDYVYETVHNKINKNNEADTKQ